MLKLVAQREVCVAVVALEGCQAFIVVAVQRRLQVRYVEAIFLQVQVFTTFNVLIRMRVPMGTVDGLGTVSVGGK